MKWGHTVRRRQSPRLETATPDMRVHPFIGQRVLHTAPRFLTRGLWFSVCNASKTQSDSLPAAPTTRDKRDRLTPKTSLRYFFISLSMHVFLDPSLRIGMTTEPLVYSVARPHIVTLFFVWQRF